MRRNLVVLFLVLILLSTPSVLAVGYTITPDRTTDTPTRTVTIEGREFDISGVARVEHGEQLAMTVDTSDEDPYEVLLYNADRETLTSREKQGPSRVVFPTDRLSAGTYAIVVSDEGGQTRAVHPVVVQGYDIDIAAPSSVRADESVTISVTVTPTLRDSAPPSVEIALARGSWNQVVEADRTSEDTYTANISPPETGDYRLYAAARGTNEVYGEQEALAISSAKTIQVSEPPTTSAPTTTMSTTTVTTSEPTATTTDGVDQSPTTRTTREPTPVPTTRSLTTIQTTEHPPTTQMSTSQPRTSTLQPTTRPATTAKTTTQATVTKTTTRTVDRTTTVTNGSPTTELTDDGILTPNLTDPTTESPGTPGFTFVVACIALVAGGVLARRDP